MIKLLNGRGQLGNALSEKIKGVKLSGTKDVYIYHTWNIDDKSKPAQQRCLEELMSFVSRNLKEKIIFVSTTSDKESHYVRYKQLAEAYLLSHCTNALVIRLPMIIGKGAVKKLKENTIKPYGTMELISLSDACEQIIKCVYYKGLRKCISVSGEKISATTVYKILSV
tara:strand:- start:97 stop:600 length:504 start_codon:yes stop_codon:yes gene_type:complete